MARAGPNAEPVLPAGAEPAEPADLAPSQPVRLLGSSAALHSVPPNEEAP
ncbi:hypothetical protein [Streptomyces sp. CBMA123]|nr:hypothetical protein [Streptomyces sp. CBMA123]